MTMANTDLHAEERSGATPGALTILTGYPAPPEDDA